MRKQIGRSVKYTKINTEMVLTNVVLFQIAELSSAALRRFKWERERACASTGALSTV